MSMGNSASERLSPTPLRFIFLNSHLHANTVTRPASPDPLYGFEVVHREDGAAISGHSSAHHRSARCCLVSGMLSLRLRRVPRIYLNKSTMLSCLLSRAKKANSLTTRLVFLSPATGIDILTLLPPELSLHILNLLLFPSGSSSGATPYQQQPRPPWAVATQQSISATAAAAAGALTHAHRRRAPRHLFPSPSSSNTSPPLRASSPPSKKSSPIVNSDCSLDLKTIARNAEYNPSSGLTPALRLQLLPPSSRSSPAAPSPAPWGVPSSPPTRPSRPLPSPAHLLPRRRPHEEAPPAPARRCLPSSSYPLTRTRTFLARPLPARASPSSAAGVPRGPRALSGHADSVYCLEFSRSRIFTGSRDRAVKVWSVRTGRLLGTFAGGHWGSVLCLKFELSSAGNLQDGGKGIRGTLVTGSSDCTVCVWDPRTESAEEDAEVRAEVRAVLRGHGGGVLDLRIDRRWIVSCSKDAVVRVWGRESLELERVLRGHEGPVNAVGLESGEYDDADAGDESEGDVGYGEGNRSQRHEGRVVSASGDGKMILWDIKSGERVRTFEGHDRGLACIEFKVRALSSSFPPSPSPSLPFFPPAKPSH
ncbi:WD40-repeat-containing domain protein [Mycena olivaceomarginata]|nr:WD40-repeat-containing domain protein [Mycena olivaceomarginata]